MTTLFGAQRFARVAVKQLGPERVSRLLALFEEAHRRRSSSLRGVGRVVVDGGAIVELVVVAVVVVVAAAVVIVGGGGAVAFAVRVVDETRIVVCKERAQQRNAAARRERRLKPTAEWKRSPSMISTIENAKENLIFECGRRAVASNKRLELGRHGVLQLTAHAQFTNATTQRDSMKNAPFERHEET